MKPYSTANRLIHLHGSNGMLNNRNKYRSMHYNKKRLEKLGIQQNGIKNNN